MCSVTWSRFPIKNLLIDSLLVSPVEWNYLNTDNKTNFSLTASFWGIWLLSVFIHLRWLKLASISIFHSYKLERWCKYIDHSLFHRETSFAFLNASSVLIQIKYRYVQVCLNTDMCNFESSQKDESRVQPAASSQAYTKPRAFKPLHNRARS